MPSLLRLFAAVAAILLAISVWTLGWRLYHGLGAAWSAPVPFAASSPSPALRDVVEPITIVEGTSFDDGGSKGLRFTDARGVLREVCLEDTRVWEDDPRVLEGRHNVILDSFYPGGERARRVPISGLEERELLGLLERWARQDPDAGELERRQRLLERGELKIDAFWEGMPGRVHSKGTAVDILLELRSRNGAVDPPP
ncbi:hypothetical protein [Paludisphaera mucosa]|uniref:Uncharacterized protein n=1 Tax=Paludisphaera mucosa TaxID=3030827 RepID=A0ABT6F9Q8_9BACT|nr:hypothetical protein [Paludisphaera mucosa]MDG3004323.1 hypothetical protein [Paludisphaera mucosa]